MKQQTVKPNIAWENDGEPNADGKFVATIEIEGVSGIQKFEGTSHKEVADKVMFAHANGTAKIASMAREQKPLPAPASKAITPVPLTAVDRVNVARDITNPETAPEAIKKVVESVVGSLDQVREKLNDDAEDKEAETARAAAGNFAKRTPEWLDTPHNKKVLVAYMQTNQMSPLHTENFVLAFEQLKEAGLVTLKQQEAVTEEETTEKPGGFPENPTSTTRARGAVSTGLRSVDSTVPTPGTKTRPKYTRADVDAMSEDVYKDKYRNEPGFRQLVDSFPPA